MLGDKRNNNYIGDPQVSSSPAYMNKNQRGNSNLRSGSGAYNGPMKVFEMPNGIRKGNFPQIKNTKSFAPGTYGDNSNSNQPAYILGNKSKNNFKSDLS